MGKVLKLRTPNGSLASVAYRKYGSQKGLAIFDKSSALAMLRMRKFMPTSRRRQSLMQRAAKFAPEAAHRATVEDRDTMKKDLKK